VGRGLALKPVFLPLFFYFSRDMSIKWANPSVTCLHYVGASMTIPIAEQVRPCQNRKSVTQASEPQLASIPPMSSPIT
jgi:hypothetical protein